MGKAHVGNVVGLGCTIDFNAGAIVSLFSEYGFEEYISDPDLLMENKMMLLMMICQLFGTLFTIGLFQKFINKERFTSIGLKFIDYNVFFLETD